MVIISFVGFIYTNGLNSGGDGTGRKRTADLLAIVQQDQRLGSTARGEIKVQLLFLGSLGQTLCTGRAGHQDDDDLVGALHIPKANMHEALRGE